ncbi:alpha/beta hydrolase [Listeria aquatica]|uniref:alpha/beta hydrolase n=1 Tax=Listeria aquatica TaxID=1494960 RepID=UPI003D072080
MKFTPPKPFLFETGKRAVLLLHGFTGSSADVRMLGRFLQENNYTAYAPQYKGHGVSPDLLLKTGPSDWWQDVLDAYDHLRELGYQEIAVCGLSLGALFSLKLGFTKPVKGIVSMSAPTKMDSSSPSFPGIWIMSEIISGLKGNLRRRSNWKCKIMQGNQWIKLRS